MRANQIAGITSNFKMDMVKAKISDFCLNFSGELNDQFRLARVEQKSWNVFLSVIFW